MEESDANDPGVRGFSISYDNDASSSSFAPGSLVDNKSSENKLLEMSESGGMSNVRDSLAWDSEFLTSSGVLDPEELSIITGGTEKGKNNLLSAIKKENSRSTDSLESLEAELFEDIRASIKPSIKASNNANSRNKVGSIAMDPKSSTTLNAANSSCKEVICSSNKSDIAARKRLNSKPASKMTAIDMQGSGKTKQDSGSPQITQSIARIGDAIQRPNIITRANSTLPMKTASLVSNRLKNEIHQAKSTTGRSSSSRDARASKITGLVAPHMAVSKPVLSSKSSFGSVTATKRPPTRFSSACDTSVSASCGKNIKSHSIPTRKIVDLRIVDQSSGGSIPKTSPNVTWRKKAPTNPHNSGGNENRVTGQPSQNIKKASTQSVIVSRPSSSRSSRSQMPSPKIFMFNGAKSVILTPMQSPSRSPSVLSKVGGGINSPNRLFKSRSSRENLTWHN